MRLPVYAPRAGCFNSSSAQLGALKPSSLRQPAALAPLHTPRVARAALPDGAKTTSHLQHQGPSLSSPSSGAASHQGAHPTHAAPAPGRQLSAWPPQATLAQRAPAASAPPAHQAGGSWTERLAALYHHDAPHPQLLEGSSSSESDAETPARHHHQTTTTGPSTAASSAHHPAAQKRAAAANGNGSSAARTQLDALQEAMQDSYDGDDDGGDLGLAVRGFAMRHVGLGGGAHAAHSQRARNGNGCSGSGSDFPDDDVFRQPSTSTSNHSSANGNGNGAAQSRAGQPARRPALQQLWEGGASARLLGVTHGAACARGRQKPDMQDHHLMVQDMLELAAHAAAPPAPALLQRRRPTAAEAGDHGAAAAGGGSSGSQQGPAALQLHQSLRRHSTTYTATPGSDTRQLLWAQQAEGPGGNGSGRAAAASAAAGARALCSSSLTGVFDGHCGSRTSRYAARRLPVLLAHTPQLWSALEGAVRPEGLSASSLSLAAGALHEVFARLDGEILDEDRHKPPGEFDGTTALVGLQVGSHLLLANLGDSRAVLCRGGEALRLTTDHTPDLPPERKRIEACGGYVREHRGVWRLVLPLGPGCGLKICAVSRALGDIDFKEPRALLSAVPDVFHCALQPHTDRFAVFATDGVWGVMSDQQAVNCVANALTQAERLGLPRDECAEVAAQALRAHAQERGSGDDITAVVALFEWDPAAVVGFDSGDDHAVLRGPAEAMADDVFASAA